MRSRIFLPLALAAALVAGAVVAQEAFFGPGLSDARDAMADRNYPEASRLLADFLRKNPEGEAAEEANVLLMRAKIGVRDFEGALAAGREFLGRFEGSSWERKVRFLMGEAFARMRGFEEAAAIYREQVDFLSGDAHERKVAGYYRALADQAWEGVEERDEFGRPKTVKDFPRALAYYLKARSIHVDDADAPLVSHRIADSYFQTKNHGRAVQEWRSLLEKWPGSDWCDDATYHVGLSFFLMNNDIEARKHLRELREKFGDSEWAPHALIALADTHRLGSTRDEGETDRALKYLRRFREQYPSHEKAEAVFFRIGAVEHWIGRYDTAIAEFRVYLGKFPDAENSPKAQDQIAWCRFRMRDYDGAIAEWKTFLGTWPNHELWTKAQDMIAQAEFEKGAHPYRLAVKAEEKKAAGLFDQARRGFRGFLAAFPVHQRVAQTQYLLGEIEHRLLDYAKALAEWDIVKTKYPKTEWAAAAMYRIAATHESDLDDLDKAIKAYEELVARYPGSGEAGTARKLLTQFREKLLEVRTERAYRTDESCVLKLRTRNIELLRLRAYRVDLAEVFRAKKVFGGITDILVEVVKPENEVTVQTPEFEKYRLFERDFALPMKGPGAWILKLEEEDLTATTLVLVSDLTIVTKHSPRQTLVFAVDSRTGRPQPNVDVTILENGGKFFEGRTDGKGVLVRERSRSVSKVKVFAKVNGSVAGTDLAASGGATFGYSAKVHIHTDRSLYRPGHEVNLKGIYRRVSRGTYAMPAKGEKLDLEIRDPRDTVIFKETVVANDYGTFSRSTWLPGTAALGTYRILATTAQKKTFTAGFEVAEYKKPEFTITCRTDRRTYLPGETVKAEVALRYFFGGPVPNTRVKYTLWESPFAFDPSVHDEFAWFTRDPERDRKRERAGYDNMRVVSQGEVRTDADGNAELEFRAADTDQDKRYIVILEALDLNRQWVRETKPVVVTRQGAYFLTKTERKVYRPGESIEVALTSVDAIHFPMAVSGELQVVRRTFEGNREIETMVSRMPAKTADDGRAEIKVKVGRPGEYRVKFVAEDRAGNRILGAAPVTIAGEAEDLGKHARVVASRQIYREGEKAEVLVNSPVAPAWVLLTFEGERVLDYRVMEIRERSTTLELPMKPEYSPNVFVKVAIPGKEQLHQAGDEIYVFKYLEVVVAPDRKEAKPGETVKVRITTTDQRGKPVTAEVGLALVDESIFALQPDLAEQIKPFFYDQRRKLAVATASSHAFKHPGTTRPTNKDILREILRREGPEKFNRTMKYVRAGKDLLQRGDFGSAAIEFRKALQVSPSNYEARSYLARTETAILAREQLKKIQDYNVEADAKGPRFADGYGAGEAGGGEGSPSRTKYADRLGELGEVAAEKRHGLGPATGSAAPRPSRKPMSPGMRASDDPKASADAGPTARGFFNDGADGDVRGRAENLFDKAWGAVPVLKDAPTLGYMFSQPGAVVPPELRKNFADTAVWLPHVVTDANGHAEVEVSLPDNLTTWRAVARGITKSTLVGEGTGDLTARKDILLRLDTPRFLTQRDQVTITSTVHNNLGQSIEVDAGLTGENITVRAPARVQVKLGPNDIRSLDFRLIAGDQGLARLTGEALTGVESDSARTGLPVLPHGLRHLIGRSGEVVEEVIEVVDLPGDIVPGTKSLVLTLSPGLDGSILESSVYLGSFPYGCLEQTVNRFLPAIAADEALRSIRSPNAALRKDLAKAVEQGLLALYAFQNSDGSFGWFSGSVRRIASDGKARPQAGDPVMTALAILAMERAREGGYRVSQKHRALALQAGQRLVKSGTNAQKAMLLFALARGGAASLEDLNQVYRYRDGLGAHALGTLALAMEATNPKRTYNAVALVRILKTMAVTENGLVHWPGEGGHGVMNDVETTAYALRALIRTEPGSDLIRGAVRWLQQKKRGSRWNSTRDTGAAVLALADHILKEGVEQAEYSVEVWLQNEETPYQKIRIEGGETVEDRLRTVIVDGARLRTGENRIKIVKRGVGGLFYTMRLDYHVAAEEIAPDGNLVRLDRRYTEYVSPLAAREGTEEIKPGWTVVRPEARPKEKAGTTIERAGSGDKFRVRLTIDAKEDLPYVILEDRLPAGVEVVQGQATGPFDWEERRDEKQVFFLTNVPRGSTVITYLVQAIHPGSFHAMPAFAYPMYEPEVWGRSGINSLTVVPESGVAGRSSGPEVITPDEVYQIAVRDYREERFAEARDGLERLLRDFRLLDKHQEECFAMLMRASFRLDDHRRAVEAYERLRELNPRRGPKTTDERRTLANAYQGIKEHERALALFRVVTDEYFGRELQVAETYRSIGNPYRAQSFTEMLLRGYPDSNSALDQFYRTANRFLEMKVPEEAVRKEVSVGVETGLMLPEALAAFRAFLSHHPESPLADDACRTAVTVLNRMERFEEAVGEAQKFIRRYRDSVHLDDVYWYLTESHFSETANKKPDYAKAMETGRVILGKKFRLRTNRRETGPSPFIPHVKHLFAKIHHLRGDLTKAVGLYKEVARNFEDARDALAFLTRTELDVPETASFGGSGPVRLTIGRKNLTGLELRIYPVDLMLLIAVKKDLKAANEIDLTGIATKNRVSRSFEGGLDYRWHEDGIDLPIGEKGVYLVVAKGGEIQKSSIVIVSDLEVSVQVIGSKVRVYATDRASRQPSAGVFVKISDGGAIKAQGFTDARGVFEARDVGGSVMVAAEKDGHYALVRR